MRRARSRGLRRSHTWTAADLRSRVTIPKDPVSFFQLVRSESVNSVKQLVKFFETKMVSFVKVLFLYLSLKPDDVGAVILLALKPGIVNSVK